MPEGHRKRPREIFFPWTKDLQTGIRVIDMDHRSLVDVVNELHANWEKGRFAEALPGLMGNLFNYCVDHFFREEKLMEDYGYPGLRLHRERHRGIRRYIYALRVVATEHPNRVDPEKLLMFLRDWLINHIGKSDMDYVGYIDQRMTEKGIGIDEGWFDLVVPSEEVTLDLHLPSSRIILVQQVAEILRGRRCDALELEKVVQEILNRHLYEIPSEESEALVHDLLR